MDDVAAVGPRHTIVVPTSGRPIMLAQALASIAAQTVADWECVVVDDGGDPAATVPADPRFRLVRHAERRGPAAARNSGLDVAEGAWVSFCDDDDLFTPERLALSERGVRRAPVVLCGLARVEGNHTDRWRPAPLRGLEGMAADRVLDDVAPHLGQVTVARGLCPRFDPSWPANEDVEWLLRLLDEQPVTTVRGTGYLLRLHGGPRGLAGDDAREATLQRLWDEQPERFRRRRARAFHFWLRGWYAERSGRWPGARRWFLRSFATRPSRRAALHLAVACRPDRLRAPRRAHD